MAIETNRNIPLKAKKMHLLIITKYIMVFWQFRLGKYRYKKNNKYKISIKMCNLNWQTKLLGRIKSPDGKLIKYASSFQIIKTVFPKNGKTQYILFPLCQTIVMALKYMVTLHKLNSADYSQLAMKSCKHYLHNLTKISKPSAINYMNILFT